MMKKAMLHCLTLFSLFLLTTACDISNRIEKDGNGGYLFAHMIKSDYGRLYYSISRDGINWEFLNEGRRIDSLYRGHPDICKGGDGIYYMIGVEEASKTPVLWRSENLISWSQSDLPKSVFQDNSHGYYANPLWYGAPKMYFDQESQKYLITWHAPREGIDQGNEWWESMRTFYVLSTDLKEFTKPMRLFDFDTEADREMATIDVIIRKVGKTYYAIIKDERWPEKCETGKTIRISTSENLIGPYSNPGIPITPSWFEAPSLVPKPGNQGWYIYAESYPNKYVLFEADSIIGPWSPVEFNLDKVRHGCVVRIDENEFTAILSAYKTMEH